MDPFLIDLIARARSFRVNSEGGREHLQIIKRGEKSVLNCVAVNSPCPISQSDLFLGFSKSAMKKEDREYTYSKCGSNLRVGENKLIRLLSSKTDLTVSEIARQCSMTYRQVSSIFYRLCEIGVLGDNNCRAMMVRARRENKKVLKKFRRRKNKKGCKFQKTRPYSDAFCINVDKLSTVYPEE